MGRRVGEFMKIEIDLKPEVAQILAIARGWVPLIDDETQPMIDDQYPQIPNPITFEQHIQEIIPPFVEDYLIIAGRKEVISGFEGILDRIKHSINSGTFDKLILAGDQQSINDLVKQSL